MSFKVGDLVECIDVAPAGPPMWFTAPELFLGGLYTIRATGSSCVTGRPTVWVKGARNRGPNNTGFLARRFRKILTPKADFIEALKSLPADLVGAE